MDLKSREEKCKRVFPAQNPKCKKLHEIHWWDGYHKMEEEDAEELEDS